MSKLPKKYKHLEIESKWQDSWKEKDVYKWQNDLLYGGQLVGSNVH